MNYIGSKYKLSNFLLSTIKSVVSEDLSDKIFCDIFAGTGIVGRTFKPIVKKVIANDCELYSYVLNRNYIANNKPIEEFEYYLDFLNNLPLVENGFIYQNYCLGGNGVRQYFSDENGKKIDTIRIKIEELKLNNEIDENTYYFLLCSLIECADKVANTASVYGAFLKHLKKTAQKELILEPAIFATTENKHDVYCKNANELIKEISGDILYMDPPYNARQYGANYHILNTIAEYKPFVPKGKTGMRDYKKSTYCSKQSVKNEFEALISNAKFQYIFLSYNNEGLMSCEEIQQIMKKYGDYSVIIQNYQRFKADKTENRNYKANTTTEAIHCLCK